MIIKEDHRLLLVMRQASQAGRQASQHFEEDHRFPWLSRKTTGSCNYQGIPPIPLTIKEDHLFLWVSRKITGSYEFIRQTSTKGEPTMVDNNDNYH